MGRYDVWVIANRKVIEITDMPGPPAEICGYVSPEAAAAAQARGHATVSEIGFPAECYIGDFDDFEAAYKAARAKADELGFKVVDESDTFDDPDDYDPADEAEYEDVEDYDDEWLYYGE